MIGVFDSGMGGLSIWQATTSVLPSVSTVYVADHAYAPYGNKSTDFLKTRGVALSKFLIAQGAQVIVVACNTATVQIPIQELRTLFPSITFVGIEPPVKIASQLTQTNNFAILATDATCRSERLKQLIKEFAPEKQVEVIPTIEWADLVEAGMPEPITTTFIQKYIDPLYNSKVDVIGLGCTHYPFLLPKLMSMYGHRFTFIDVSKAVAQRVNQLVAIAEDTQKGLVTHRFFTTAPREDSFKQSINDLLRLQTSVESIQI